MKVGDFYVYLEYDWELGLCRADVYSSREAIKTQDPDEVIASSAIPLYLGYAVKPKNWGKQKVRAIVLNTAFHQLGFKVKKRRGNIKTPGEYVLIKTRDTEVSRVSRRRARQQAERIARGFLKDAAEKARKFIQEAADQAAEKAEKVTVS